MAVPLRVDVALGSHAVQQHCILSEATPAAVYADHPAYLGRPARRIDDSPSAQQSAGIGAAQSDGQTAAAKAEDSADKAAATAQFEEWQPTVVISGTTRFYESVAQHVRPLGRLAAGGAFYEHPQNLMVFLQVLNELAAPGVLFLCATDDLQSSAEEVGQNLASCLLEHSASFSDRAVTAATLDSLLGDSMASGWLQHSEDAIVLAQYEQDELESYQPASSSDGTAGQSQTQSPPVSVWLSSQPTAASQDKSAAGASQTPAKDG